MIGLKLKLIIGAAVIAAVGAVFWYMQWQMGKMQESMQILSANNAVLEVAVGTQKDAIGALEYSVSDAIRSSKVLATKLAKADTHRQEIVQEFNSYRTRLHNVAIQKPTLIERRANIATAGVMREFDRATGSSKHASPDTTTDP